MSAWVTREKKEAQKQAPQELELLQPVWLKCGIRQNPNYNLFKDNTILCIINIIKWHNQPFPKHETYGHQWLPRSLSTKCSFFASVKRQMSSWNWNIRRPICLLANNGLITATWLPDSCRTAGRVVAPMIPESFGPRPSAGSVLTEPEEVNMCEHPCLSKSENPVQANTG